MRGLCEHAFDRGGELTQVAVQRVIEFGLVQAVNKNGIARLRVGLTGTEVMAKLQCWTLPHSNKERYSPGRAVISQ